MYSICFQDASVKRQRNEITEDEYLQFIVNHCTGIRHGANKLCNNDAIVDASDHVAFGYNIDDSFTYTVAEWIFYYFKSPLEGSTL
jgi:hypothetical protein